MKKHMDLGEVVKGQLAQYYMLQQIPIGQDALLTQKGMRFETESYTVDGIGHLCILRMKTIAGLMKMETAVLSTVYKDVPLINADWISLPGKETQMIELYDTQLVPFPEDILQKFGQIRDRDAGIEDYRNGQEHWYDQILYPCSYHKKGKTSQVSGRFSRAVRDYFRLFIRQLRLAPDCDARAKREKTKWYAETLFEQGGPAVDQVSRLFGEDTAKRLILAHMYGVE